MSGNGAYADCARALETARQLAEHDPIGALKVLEGANPEDGDERAERALVRLRREAFRVLPSVRGRLVAAEPCGLERDPSGLPALDAGDLKAERVRFAIESHGSLIVRGLLDDASVVDLRNCVGRALGARERLRETGEAGSIWYEELEEVPDHGREFSGKGGVHAADSPRGLARLVAALKGAGIGDLVAEYFGEAPAITFQKTMLRRAQPTGGGAWHQDGAFLGSSVRALNVWIALSPCGETAPGLSVIPRRVEEILPTGGIFSWDIGGRTLLRCFKGITFARPMFVPGDALLFDHLCVHSTYQSPQMSEARDAVESWFFPPSSQPLGRTGLAF